MKQTFEVIDSMPGSGKTEYFVKVATAVLRQEDPKWILIYVAPTVELLKEVYTRLQLHTKIGILKKRVTIAISPEHQNKFEDTLGHYCTKPVALLDYMLGLIPEKEYLLHNTQRVDLAKEGSIIMTTHQTFMLIHTLPRAELDLSYLNKSWVFFDEARRCINNSASLELPKALLAGLTGFKPQEIEVKDKESGAPVNLLKLTSSPNKIELKKILGLSVSTRIPKDVITLQNLVKQSQSSGRSSVYILVRLGFGNVVDSKTKDSLVKVFTVVSPDRVFDNYGRVTLTSAFFKDSQVYHFLKNKGSKFNFLLDNKKLNSTLQTIKERDYRLRRVAANNLVYAPLLDNTIQLRSPKSYSQKLTATLLTNSAVVPKTFISELDGLKDNFPNTSRDDFLRNLAISPFSVTSNKATRKILSEYLVPPLWVLMRQAYLIISEWNKGKPFRALTIMNSIESKKLWAPARVAFRSSIANARRSPTLKNFKDYDNLNKQDSIDAKFMTEDWFNFFKDTKGILTIPNTPVVQGLNEWSDYNFFIHLGALNPDPDLVLMFRILLPTYNIDSDHYVDNLVQTLYRTSLRKPDSKETVLMIVPFTRAANDLYLKLNLPEGSIFKKFDTKIPPIVGWSGYDTEVAAKSRAEALSKANTIYTDSERKTLTLLNSKINNLKKYGVLTASQQARLDQAMNEKQSIKTTATLRKRERQMQEEEDNDYGPESVNLAGYGDC